MKVIKVTTKEVLEELRNKGIFTWEGMSDNEDNLKAIEKAIRNYGFNKKQMVVYTFKGSLMNKTYHLKGNNAYHDDLTFVSIEDFYNSMFKVRFGARWLDDIIDNLIRSVRKWTLIDY